MVRLLGFSDVPDTEAMRMLIRMYPQLQKMLNSPQFFERNVLCLFKSTDNGSSHDNEPAIRRDGPRCVRRYKANGSVR